VAVGAAVVVAVGVAAEVEAWERSPRS